MHGIKFTLKPVDPQIRIIAEKFQHNTYSTLEILKEIQEKHGWISPEQISDLGRELKLPAGTLYGIASFYSMLNLTPKGANTIRICDGPVCWLNGSHEIYQAIDLQLKLFPEWHVGRTSCLGLCDRAPSILINQEQAGAILKKDIPNLFYGWRGQPVDYSKTRNGEIRVMMANAGKINPDSLKSALEHGAYQGLKVAIKSPPEHSLLQIENSGLSGRGGAGFPVGRKWRFVRQANRLPKYIICNADESEPLIFKDRVLIDSNPHQILEGMAIAGYCTGASEGFIYIRGEYKSQAERIEQAIHSAENEGFLGDHILGTNYTFRIHLHRGAGAYICGEETALIESLEGKRGEPRLRPPFPPQYGYLGLPTLVNNVESFASVPPIILHGAEWFRSLSTYSTPGTKMYMVLGHIQQPGLFEAPFGITLRQVIEDYGGGLLPNSKFNFALTGGAAGTIVPDSLLDVPIDYASAMKGVSLGAGAFLVCDQSISPVEMLREILHFFEMESCGKCTPCRVGTYLSRVILDRLITNRGLPGDTSELNDLADLMQDSSFCGLGQSVAVPVKSALSHFSEIFTSLESTHS